MEAYDMIPDDWSEPIIEEWKEKLDKLGFKDAKILFSGFGSQGDGACFEATVKKDWVTVIPKKVMDELTVAVVTLKLDGEPESRWSWWWPVEDWCWDFSLKHSGHYCHENSVDLYANVSFPDHLPEFWKWWKDLRDDIRAEAKRLSRQIYSELEDAYGKEYEYAEEELKRMKEEEGDDADNQADRTRDDDAGTGPALLRIVVDEPAGCRV